MSGARRPWWLRCYPRSWRQRYGAELSALVDDAHGGRPPWPTQVGLVRAGLTERARAAGLRRHPDPASRAREGGLLVLWGWALFVIAGCVFAKFAEHWDAFTPSSEHAVPSAAYTAVAVAATFGAGLVVAAAAVALPAFGRARRAGAWPRVARPVWRAVAVFTATAAATAGVAVWAHHLEPAQRGGATPGFALLAAVWVGLVVASILVGASAAAACARVVALSPRQLRILGALADGTALCMAVIAAGTLVWWVALASSAPGFLAQGPAAISGAPLPPALVGAAVLMVAGLALAVVGVIEVWTGRRQLAA